MSPAPCAHVWQPLEQVVVRRVTLRGVSHKEGRRYRCERCGALESRVEPWQKS